MSQLVRGAPGLYLRGLPSEPVLPLSAITGFVGIAERGPLHRPQPLRTWDEYLMVFGGLIDYGFLPHAVFGFFRNGGRRCFVVRAADLTDYAALNLPNRCPQVELLRAAANTAPINDTNGQETLRIAAIDEGRWGNALRFELHPASQRHLPLTSLTARAPAGATTVTVAEPFDLAATMSVRLAPPADPFGGRLVQVQSVAGATGVVTLTGPLDVAMPRGTLVLGQGFKLVVRLAERTEVFDNLSMSPTNPRYVVTVVNGPDDALPYVERQAEGHSVLVRTTHVVDPVTLRSRFRPVPSAGSSTLTGGGDGFRYSAATLRDAANQASIRVVVRAAPDNLDALGSKGDALRVRARPFATTTALAVAAGVDRVVVDNAAGLGPGDSLTLTDPAAPVTETHPIVSVGPDNVVRLNTGLGAGFPLGAAVTVANRFTLTVFQGTAPEPVEVHRNLSADPVDPRYFRPQLAAASTRLCGDGPDVALQPPVTETTLSGGRDPGTIDLRWYTGYDGDGRYFVPPGAPPTRRYGLASLEIVDEIDLVTVPDLTGQTLLPPDGPSGQEALYLLAHRQVLYHASRLGDRLALLDTRLGVAPLDAARLPQQLADPVTAKFGALYYPWLTVTVGAESRRVPPSGFVAGVIARADFEGGVGRAPANFPLKDVVDLEALLEQGDQDDLNPAGVNAVRKFEAPALELWGARTLSTEPSARYVNVRRVLIAVKKAIGRTLLWTVFEPNGPELRRRIQANLESLLQTLVAGGATPATGAFFVRCDDENNPPEVVDAGQVVALIGLALVAPAEFIILNVKRTPDAVSVSEEAG
jgi:Phage tail sheath protein subtilisin-like domain/Phage tail sheath C-terminal domain